MGTLVDTILGSGINYVGLAVPFFFLLIGIEIIAGIIERKQLYRFNDSITDLSCGIVDQVLAIFLNVLLFASYLYLFEHFRVFEFADASPAVKWIAAIGLLFGVDFCFYWFHRIAHEYAAPWATHVVHHQSEEYNLTVALRQSAFEGCFAWMFYLPLAVIGFPPIWYVSMKAINLLYQFWIHTEAIDRLGPLEWVMNTPSHHRVHHARNPKYLDKNYAGMFIIWDRMFGTFEPEVEQPVYGITKPLKSMNPLWANLGGWVELFEDAWHAPRWRDKIKIWFMPLGWIPPGLPERPRAQEVTRATVRKYNPQIPRGLSAYVLVQFALVLVLGVTVTNLADQHVAWQTLVLPAIFVLWSVGNMGGVLERKPWAFFVEIARLIVLPAAVAFWPDLEAWRMPLGISAVAFVGASIAWLAFYRGQFTAQPDAMPAQDQAHSANCAEQLS